MNFENKEWKLKDSANEMGGAFAISVMSYFDELEEVEEVCMGFLNDIHLESQIENISLIKNAPNMYRFLKKAQDRLPLELKKELNKIWLDLVTDIEIITN